MSYIEETEELRLRRLKVRKNKKAMILHFENNKLVGFEFISKYKYEK